MSKKKNKKKKLRARLQQIQQLIKQESVAQNQAESVLQAQSAIHSETMESPIPSGAGALLNLEESQFYKKELKKVAVVLGIIMVALVVIKIIDLQTDWLKILGDSLFVFLHLQ